MALNLSIIKGNIEVVPYIDDAVTCERDSYDQYLKSFELGDPRGNEALLELEGEPTRFVLRRELDKQSSMLLLNSTQRIGEKPSMALILEDVRYSLAGINGPEGALKFEKGEDGLVSNALLATLDGARVTAELFAARANSISQAGNIKKKSKPSLSSST